MTKTTLRAATLAFSLLAAATLCTAADAQGRGGPPLGGPERGGAERGGQMGDQGRRPGRPGGPAGLLLMPEVVRELGLTSGQIEQIKTILEEGRPKFDRGGEPPARPDRESFEAKNAELQAKIRKVLSGDQSQRWQEIRLQVEVPQALMEAPVARALGLSAAQIERLAELRSPRRDRRPGGPEAGRDRNGGRPLHGPEGPDGPMPPRGAHIESQLKEILTSAQYAKLTSLRGKPFAMPMRQRDERRGPGGPVGPGGPGTPDF